MLGEHGEVAITRQLQREKALGRVVLGAGLASISKAPIAPDRRFWFVRGDGIPTVAWTQRANR
jgi:hypothetical protein